MEWNSEIVVHMRTLNARLTRCAALLNDLSIDNGCDVSSAAVGGVANLMDGLCRDFQGIMDTIKGQGGTVI